ncbi:hypothetical protein OTK49_26650 [Vibrio coralliirubri]|uniref:hypothetical protein n=1 Tax=Vibrio coralliirubri TaxID=1516159 RepID=UPI002283C629|nr:hypothetical protein [Vibrio coralliirubri]MCY9866121.1 hypothetical protein [Vibrio coralliirubri]
MKLSEINTSDKSTLHGLELDAVPATLPENLCEISVKAILKDGALCPTFVTNLVTWNIKSRSKNIYTIVEFEDVEPTEVARLILVCGNLQVGISILPPSVNTEESNAKYIETLAEATKALLNFKGSTPYLFPVCNYLEYMAANVLTNIAALEPKDDYTIRMFKEQMSQELVDDVKSHLAEVIYECAGGQKAFEKSVKLFAYVAAGKAEDQMAGRNG